MFLRCFTVNKEFWTVLAELSNCPLLLSHLRLISSSTTIGWVVRGKACAPTDIKKQWCCSGPKYIGLLGWRVWNLDWSKPIRPFIKAGCRSALSICGVHQDAFCFIRNQLTMPTPPFDWQAYHSISSVTICFGSCGGDLCLWIGTFPEEHPQSHSNRQIFVASDLQTAWQRVLHDLNKWRKWTLKIHK